MAEFIDFEDLLNVHDIRLLIETGNAWQNPQELAEVLEKMFETVNVETDTNDAEIVNDYNVTETDETLTPTAAALAEFQKIYNDTCFANDNTLKTNENTVSLYTNLSENTIQMIQKQYDDTINHLDELDSIINESIDKVTEAKSETKENVDNTAYLSSEIDLNVNIEGPVTQNTEPKTESNNIKDTNVTKLNDNDVDENKNLKVDLKDSHDFKTIKIDVTNDDIISISSESDDDGYNSSDFEFITEAEAKEGVVRPDNIKPHELNNNAFVDSTPDYIKYHKNRYIRCIAEKTNADREPHVIPEGEKYFDLFRETYSPINGMQYSTTKQLSPAKSMVLNTDGDGFGFDLPVEVVFNPVLENEANETAKKIRFLYPDENRKRRRF